MIRIGLTQRVDVITARGERRDASDQRWFPMLRSLGILAVPLPNDPDAALAIAKGMDLSGLILAGGNDIASYGNGSAWAPERDQTERDLLEYAKHLTFPVLGVCRGMQMLNVFHGGSLTPVEGHVAVRHALASTDSRFSRDVNSYHSFGIGYANMAGGFSSLATAADGTVEAMRHTMRNWIGIMWHPEREPTPHPDDMQLISDLFGAGR